MEKRIAVLPGDGIGKEIIQGAIEILEAVGERYHHQFSFTYGEIGGSAIDATGVPLPDETISLCKESDAILLGAVGGPKWETLPVHLRPEQGLLQIRKELNLLLIYVQLLIIKVLQIHHHFVKILLKVSIC